MGGKPYLIPRLFRSAQKIIDKGLASIIIAIESLGRSGQRIINEHLVLRVRSQNLDLVDKRLIRVMS